MEKIILEELVKLNNCYGKLSNKIDNLDKKIDERTQELDKKIDNLDKKFDKKIDDVLNQFGDTLDIIDEVILKSKQEIIDKFEKQNDKNEIRLKK